MLIDYSNGWTPDVEARCEARYRRKLVRQAKQGALTRAKHRAAEERAYQHTLTLRRNARRLLKKELVAEERDRLRAIMREADKLVR